MLIGFGCTVPATYATRTLREEKDGLLTAQLLSLMSCGARLPVYTVFGAAFFAERAGWFVFGLYLFGIIITIVMEQIFRRTLFVETGRAADRWAEQAFYLPRHPQGAPAIRGQRMKWPVPQPISRTVRTPGKTSISRRSRLFSCWSACCP